MRKLILPNLFKPLAVASVLGVLIFSCQTSNENLPFDALSELAVVKFANGDIIPGKFIVVLKPSGLALRKSMGYEEVQSSMRKTTVSLLAKYRIAESTLDQVYGNTIEGFSIALTEEQAEALANDPAVSYIEPDRIMGIAQKGRPGGGGGSTGQTTPWGITRIGGAVNYTGSNKAYILDSGIDLDHPDLNVNANAGFNAFTSGKDSRSLDDGNGHGTHVAGTIAAINNSIGVVGVAAGAQVVPIKVLGATGSGSYSGVIAGINYVGATGNSGDVANMSLGGPFSQAVNDAVVAAASNGIKFALAAGNESQNTNNVSPGSANGTHVYTVSAMNSSDSWASFSNFGNPPVDYCAPGVSIQSTWKSGGYNTISGTSMATPHVAGILLLGNINTDGTVKNDPDGTPDPIAVR
ncbi:S8 family serine peptidase [Algoriphagus confluentis]|uniref:Peptidase inhibitor I9 n=1 Tax=Algoriphagus confluentis TaxID=1697556 RepID=A0ABQ6PQF4_9BACT|nr:hypothetical protein Aconfl_20660 [Algoriphagus confluentis]